MGPACRTRPGSACRPTGPGEPAAGPGPVGAGAAACRTGVLVCHTGAPISWTGVAVCRTEVPSMGRRCPRDSAGAARWAGLELPRGRSRRCPVDVDGAGDARGGGAGVPRRWAVVSPAPPASPRQTDNAEGRTGRRPRQSGAPVRPWPAPSAELLRPVTRRRPAARWTLFRALFRPWSSRDNTAHESAGSRAGPRGRLVAGVVRRRQRRRGRGRGRPGTRRGGRCRAVRHPGHPRRTGRFGAAGAASAAAGRPAAAEAPGLRYGRAATEETPGPSHPCPTRTVPTDPAPLHRARHTSHLWRPPVHGPPDHRPPTRRRPVRRATSRGSPAHGSPVRRSSVRRPSIRGRPVPRR